MAVHMKFTSTKAWVWVTELKTAQVVSDATVRIYDINGKQLAQGKTNSQGLAFLSFAEPFKNTDYSASHYFRSGFLQWQKKAVISALRTLPGIKVWNHGVFNCHPEDPTKKFWVTLF